MNSKINGDCESKLKMLNNSGFLIYQGGVNWWTLHKIATPEDEREFSSNFNSYDEAMFQAIKSYYKKVSVFKAVVRYDRGLGIEYRNIPDIRCNSMEEASRIAEQEAEKLLGEEADIKEIRFLIS